MSRSSTELGSFTEPKQLVSNEAPGQTPITSEPQATTMDQTPNGDDHTIHTASDAQSGYHRDTNECTEFCQDFVTCFGACDACCPSSGEGCLSSFALFVGNLCFACCKC